MATGGASDIERGTDETFDNLCSPCSRKNKNAEGSKFCTDCQEYFCSVCVNSHNDFPTLRDHKVLDKAKFQPGSSVQFPTVPTERCKVHGHKPVDMYCRKHDAVGCSTCMVMQHSTCKDKEYVPNYIKRIKVESPSTVVEQLGTIASSLGTLHKTFLKDKTNLQSRKDKAMQEIKNFRLKIDKQLDKLEKKTVDDLDGVFESLDDKIDATLKELQAAITSVQSAQDNLKSAGNNASQMFVSAKMANNVVSNANETVTTTHHQVCSTDILFVSNQKLQFLLKWTEALGSISKPEELQSQLRGSTPLLSVNTTHTNTTSHLKKTEALGSISRPEELQSQLRGSSPLLSVDTTESNGNSSSLFLMQVNNIKKYSVSEKSDNLLSVETTQTSTSSNGSQSSLSLMQVKNSKKYSVSEKSDNSCKCSVVSICELDDGIIILSDSCHYKLKRLYSPSYMVIDSCTVPIAPHQVCTISSQEVAVCCYYAKLVQFVSIGLTMQMTRQIKTGFECSGLAYNDEKLFISDGFQSVYVYTVTGDRLQQFNKSGFIKRMFADTYFNTSIAVSSDGSTIYIAHYEKGLIILDRNGQLVGEFTDPKPTGARGVCFYKNNSILVCREFPYNVLQFTTDGKQIGEVLKRESACRAICYCKKSSKLIVGLEDGIEVYDING